MKTRVCLKYFVNNSLWKQFFVSNSPKTPSILIALKILLTLESLSKSFNLKLKKLSCKKVLKFAFLRNCFSDLFTEVKIWLKKTLKSVLGRFLER